MHIWLLTVLVLMRLRAIVLDLAVERSSLKSRQRKRKTKSLVRHPLAKLVQARWWLKMFHSFLWDNSVRMIKSIRMSSRSFVMACGTFKYFYYFITNTIFDPCPWSQHHFTSSFCFITNFWSSDPWSYDFSTFLCSLVALAVGLWGIWE